MSKDNIKMKVALPLSEALKRARKGKIMRYKEWPETKFMICMGGTFYIIDSGRAVHVILDYGNNIKTESRFAELMPAEYMGVAWEEK